MSLSVFISENILCSIVPVFMFTALSSASSFSLFTKSLLLPLCQMCTLAAFEWNFTFLLSLSMSSGLFSLLSLFLLDRQNSPSLYVRSSVSFPSSFMPTTFFMNVSAVFFSAPFLSFRLLRSPIRYRFFPALVNATYIVFRLSTVSIMASVS